MSEQPKGFKTAKHANNLRFVAKFVQDLSEDDCFALMCRLRWGEDEKQTCSRCGSHAAHYFISKTKRFNCKHCMARFSVTSGTMFDSTKLKFKEILSLVFEFATPATGGAALENARRLGYNEATVRVLFDKFRESIMRSNAHGPIRGLVQIDGKHSAGRPRHTNRKENRKDHRKEPAGQNASVILGVSHVKNMGGMSMFTRVAQNKVENDPNFIYEVLSKTTTKDSVIITDDAPAMAIISLRNPHFVVNHSECFSDEGVNTNQAESFNARVEGNTRRLTHHSVEKKLLYATEIAWRNDMSNRSPVLRALDVLRRMLRLSPSIYFRGYFQGKGAAPENRLMMPLEGDEQIQYPDADLVGDPTVGGAAILPIFNNHVVEDAAGVLDRYAFYSSHIRQTLKFSRYRRPKATADALAQGFFPDNPVRNCRYRQ